MSSESSLRILTAAAVGKNLKFLHSSTSSVTTSWGVDWNEEFIARDLWQNFFDANRQCLSEVKVSVQDHAVTISAPTAMELARLFYLGSEKGDDDVGKYGEGFNLGTVCLLRNHDIEPIVASGGQVVYVRLDGQTVSGTQLRPLVYDFFTTAEPVAGDRLILRGEQKSRAARAAVVRERKECRVATDGDTVEATLRSMTEDQLRDLLKRVPEVTLRRALKDGNDETFS